MQNRGMIEKLCSANYRASACVFFLAFFPPNVNFEYSEKFIRVCLCVYVRVCISRTYPRITKANVNIEGTADE